MTGWRLGYAAVPAPLVEPITRLIVNSVSCTPPAVQLAGVAALEGPRDAVDAMREEFRRRRDVVVPRPQRPARRVAASSRRARSTPSPTSATPGIDTGTLANRLLDEAGVAVLAGTAFGANGEGYLRLSYANSLENIEAALGGHGRAAGRVGGTVSRVVVSRRIPAPALERLQAPHDTWVSPHDGR